MSLDSQQFSVVCRHNQRRSGRVRGRGRSESILYCSHAFGALSSLPANLFSETLSSYAAGMPGLRNASHDNRISRRNLAAYTNTDTVAQPWMKKSLTHCFNFLSSAEAGIYGERSPTGNLDERLLYFCEYRCFLLRLFFIIDWLNWQIIRPI